MPRPSWKRRLLLLLLLVVVGYVAYLYRSIVHQSSQDESRPADAIVVFGAAEYVGKPSPVYRARLDHAADLYRKGLAPIVITTGGAGADPHFTEGGVGREYLKSQGIPDDHLIAETQSPDTAESARRISTIMRTNHMKTCLAVSDAYHIFRIKQMLAREGMTAYGAPRPNSKPAAFGKKNEAVFHEIASYMLWVLHLS
ncbi:MAG: YdcF family protein [Candidatus Angelobacter sp. Gp1-AA117]|nr:MAG: YdcF family protein [Candidatus Angelobacter sp. Gp1-AA117]